MKNKTIKTILIICIFLLLGAYRLVREKNRTVDSIEIRETDGTASVTFEEVIPKKVIYIQICGYVNNPGVFEVQEDTRLFEVLELAGGVAAEGSTDSLWLAKIVKDGERIYVPGKDEMIPYQYEDGLINVNTANVDELMKLPGIGESRAQDIVNYRQQNGDFQKIEDIMNVSGIKESAFNKIKDKITT